MDQASNKTLFILALTLILISSANTYRAFQVPVKSTGSAVGDIDLFIYPTCAEATNETLVTTSGNLATTNATNQTVKTYLEITTDSNVVNETVYIARCDSNIQNVGVSGETVVKTYMVESTSTLSSELNQLVTQFHYLDSWVSDKNLTESTLSLYRWTGSNWTEYGSLDADNNYVSGTATAFGTFGIFGAEEEDEVDEEEVSLSPGGGGGTSIVAEEVEEVSALQVFLKPPAIVRTAQKVVSEPVKKIIKYVSPVASQYWPVLLLTTLLVIGMGYWVGKRRTN